MSKRDAATGVRMMLMSMAEGLRVAGKPWVLMEMGADLSTGQNDVEDLRAVLSELYALRRYKARRQHKRVR